MNAQSDSFTRGGGVGKSGCRVKTAFQTPRALVSRISLRKGLETRVR